MKQYDLIVIGGGAAGLVAAKFAAGIGKKVLIIEKEKLGGECTWSGCVPSKTLIKAANVARVNSNLTAYGLSGECRLSTDNLLSYVRSVSEEVYQTHTPEQLEKDGIEVCFGSASFTDPHTLSINNEPICGKKIIIATGTSPFVPPIKGLDTVPFFTNQNFFNQDQLPTSLLIVGGGAIGVEMACALQALGVEVSVIERADRILVHQDEELTLRLQESMVRRGSRLLVGKSAISVAQSSAGVSAVLQAADGSESTIEAEQLLIAAGRRPNIDGLNLDKIGVEHSPQGISVNKQLQTSVSHIYAAGDVAGPYLFSHMAYYQASIAARNALLPFWKSVNYTDVTWTIFSNPEFASAGLTQEEARAQYGDTIQIYRYDYKDLDRAKTDAIQEGMGKVICTKRGKIIGAHILGERAGEIIHEIQVGKTYGIPFTDFYSVIHAYPTYSELIWHMAKKAYIGKLRNNPLLKLLLRLFRH